MGWAIKLVGGAGVTTAEDSLACSLVDARLPS